MQAVVGSVGVVEVLEALDKRSELTDGPGQLVGFVEFAAPGFLHALDGAVELGASGWQDKERAALVAQASSKAAMNSLPPSTWIASIVKGQSSRTLSRKRAAVALVALLAMSPTVQRLTGQLAEKCLSW